MEEKEKLTWSRIGAAYIAITIIIFLLSFPLMLIWNSLVPVVSNYTVPTLEYWQTVQLSCAVFLFGRLLSPLK